MLSLGPRRNDCISLARAQRTICDRIDLIESLQSSDAIRETKNFVERG
jgi:hypothetical protein